MPDRILVPGLIAIIVVRGALWYFLPLYNIDVFSSGNDSNLYDRYATYQIDNAPNAWPIILRQLNDWNVYDRRTVSLLLAASMVTFVPWMVARLMRNELPGKPADIGRRAIFTLVVLVAAYPSTMLFSLDIYRDPLMLCLFLASALSAQKFFTTSGGGRLAYVLLFGFFCSVCFVLRAYLGMSLVVAFAGSYSFRVVSLRPAMLMILTCVGVIAIYVLGLLNDVIAYRGEFGFQTGSSTFGLSLVGVSVPQFAYLLVLLSGYQVAGLYVFRPVFLLFFILESLPTIAMLIVALRNYRYLRQSGHFMLIFSIIYTLLWVIGNDNMGTALRLRMPTYLAFTVLFGMVYSRKIYAWWWNEGQFGRTRPQPRSNS